MQKKSSSSNDSRDNRILSSIDKNMEELVKVTKEEKKDDIFFEKSSFQKAEAEERVRIETRKNFEGFAAEPVEKQTKNLIKAIAPEDKSKGTGLGDTLLQRANVPGLIGRYADPYMLQAERDLEDRNMAIQMGGATAIAASKTKILGTGTDLEKPIQMLTDSIVGFNQAMSKLEIIVQKQTASTLEGLWGSAVEAGILSPEVAAGMAKEVQQNVYDAKKQVQTYNTMVAANMKGLKTPTAEAMMNKTASDALKQLTGGQQFGVFTALGLPGIDEGLRDVGAFLNQLFN